MLLLLFYVAIKVNDVILKLNLIIFSFECFYLFFSFFIWQPRTGQYSTVMDKNKKLRAILRSSFTRIINSLKEELQNDYCNIEQVQGKLQSLEGKIEEMKELDKQILDFLLDQEDVTEDDLNCEVKSADDYVEAFHSINVTINNRLQNSGNESVLSRLSTETSKKRFKLPTIEFIKFSGKLEEWLPFWSQFRRIDEDDEIDEVDKFQYLLQATVPKSKARQIVESYPPTGNNYSKAIESLKLRFGREDLLVEVYIRDLLKLVLTNLNNKTGLAYLYDQIESRLRALETLNVTSETCAAMLYPLVESCLPEEVLRVWQRQPTFNEDSTLKSRLDCLMEFLRKEVNNEERIALAVSGFDVKHQSESNTSGHRFSNKKLFNSPKPKPTKSDFVPTASDLIGLNHKSENLLCAFCNGAHVTVSCTESENLTVPEKIDLLSKKSCCFRCTKYGHLSNKCRVKISCSLC